MTRAGIWLLGAIVLGVLLGPLVWSIPPGQMDLTARSAAPGLAHPLGTDQLGRDLLAQLLAGGRISLAVGAAAMAVSVGLGTLIGVLAGMIRPLDAPLMRLTDMWLALPVLPVLLIAVMLFRAPLNAALGPEVGIFALIVLGIGATSWMGTARILRGEVLALMGRDFIRAARSTGTRPGAMITRHILPNIAGALGVSASLSVAGAILMESALSYLGLGFPPDMPSWGRLLQDGTAHMGSQPGRALWPGALITATALAVTWLGDGLRDARDMRQR